MIKLLRALSGTCIAWLLAGYLVPGTIWARYSASNYIDLVQLANPSFNWHAIASAVGLGSLACLALTRLRMLRNSLWWIVCLYIGVYAFTPWLYGFDRITAEPETSVLACTVVGLLAAILVDDAELICLVVGFLCTVQACYAISDAIWRDNSILSGGLLRSGGTFGHPEPVYVEMLFGAPIAIVAALTIGRSIPHRLFWTASACAQVIALILTWYRGGVVALAVALIWLSLKVGRDKRKTIYVALSCLIVVALTFFARVDGPRNHVSTVGSNRGHIMLVRDGLHHFEQHWLTGVGLCQPIDLILVDPAVKLPPNSYYDPQNLLLEWLDDMGIGGGLLLLAFIFAVCVEVGRDRTNVAYGIGAGWLGIMIAGVSNTPFGIPGEASGSVISGALLGAVLMLGNSSTVPDAGVTALVQDKSLSTPICLENGSALEILHDYIGYQAVFCHVQGWHSRSRMEYRSHRLGLVAGSRRLASFKHAQLSLCLVCCEHTGNSRSHIGSKVCAQGDGLEDCRHLVRHVFGLFGTHSSIHSGPPGP